MTDSIRDMEIGKLAGQLNMIINDMTAATLGRKEMHLELKDIAKQVHGFNAAIEHLSDRVAALEPDVKDYRTIRTKAEGAGWLGKGLWLIGVSLIGGVFWLVSNLNWMIGRSN